MHVRSRAERTDRRCQTTGGARARNGPRLVPVNSKAATLARCSSLAARGNGEPGGFASSRAPAISIFAQIAQRSARLARLAGATGAPDGSISASLAGRTDISPDVLSRTRTSACTCPQVSAICSANSTSAHAALEELCSTYWFPLYAYVRRGGRTAEEAQDLTQAFFLRLLEKQSLRLADSARGKFRTFLLTSLKNFLINEWEKARAAKRGSGQAALPLELDRAEQRYLAAQAARLGSALSSAR